MANIKLTTVDNDTVEIKNNKVVGPNSRFDGRTVKSNKDIAEIFGETVGQPNLDHYKKPQSNLMGGDAGEQELYKAMIEVFKGNITGPEAQQIMQAAQGEFPMEFIAKEQQKYMQQQEKMLPNITPNAGGQLLPDGTRLPSTDPRYGKFPGQRLNPVRPNMGQITGSGIGPQTKTTKPMDLRKMILANITGLI